LYVAEAARRKGVGKLLMRHLYDIAIKYDCSRVEWTTDRDNIDAQRFYAELGVPVKESKLFYRIEGDELRRLGGQFLQEPLRRILLSDKVIRIGRVPDNDVILADLDVSRHHAELRKSPSGDYEVVDLGSHNGTFVNDNRITSAVLSDRDVVSIGHAWFRIVDGEFWQFSE
jgi:hypothetical protein